MGGSRRKEECSFVSDVNIIESCKMFVSTIVFFAFMITPVNETSHQAHSRVQ